MTTLISLIVGFLLTTVLGGLLGWWLQQRTLEHQRALTLSDKELDTAGSTCELVSTLLDKRLYRMLRLYYALRAADGSTEATEAAQARMRDYDAILYEWNDQLNGNLSLMGAYFGHSARDWLHFEIYERCKTIGAELEAMYKHVLQGSALTIDISDLELHLRELNEQVYRLGVFMMTQLRSGNVGRTAPDPVMPPSSPRLVSGSPLMLPGIAPLGDPNGAFDR